MWGNLCFCRDFKRYITILAPYPQTLYAVPKYRFYLFTLVTDSCYCQPSLWLNSNTCNRWNTQQYHPHLSHHTEQHQLYHHLNDFPASCVFLLVSTLYIAASHQALLRHLRWLAVERISWNGSKPDQKELHGKVEVELDKQELKYM